MKKLLILVCALVFATAAFAGQAKNAPRANYAGVIEKYDAATRTLTVKRKDKQGEFILNDSSEVLNNKGKADASAFTAGQKVDVEFVMDGSKKMIVKAKVSGSTSK